MPGFDLRTRVLAAAENTESPTRSAWRRSAAALLGGAAIASTATLFVAGGVHAEGRSAALMVATAAGAACVAGFAISIAFVRGRHSVGRPGWQLLALILLVPLVLLGWKLGWSAAVPAAMRSWAERPGLRCLGLSLVTAAGPLIAMISLRRGSDPVRPTITGGAIGATAGAVAWVLIDLWCPVAEPAHLLLGHVLPLGILVAVGAAAGRRWVALR